MAEGIAVESAEAVAGGEAAGDELPVGSRVIPTVRGEFTAGGSASCGTELAAEGGMVGVSNEIELEATAEAGARVEAGLGVGGRD